MRRMSVIIAPPVGLGLSIKALPPQGLNPAGKEDQLSRADCREGSLTTLRPGSDSIQGRSVQFCAGSHSGLCFKCAQIHTSPFRPLLCKNRIQEQCSCKSPEIVFVQLGNCSQECSHVLAILCKIREQCSCNLAQVQFTFLKEVHARSKI